MILELFLALVALAVVACILGHFTDDAIYLTVGLTILFLVSIVILTGNLEYQTGEALTVDYQYSGGVLTNQTVTGTFQYTSWDDNTSHKVGWILAIMSAIGVALSLYNTKKTGAENA